MAEGVLFNLAGKVLEMLGPLTLQEINLAYGDVKAELENIKNTIFIIQAVLLDAEKQGSHNNKVKDYLNKLRDVLLDADDVLDDLSTEDSRYKMMTGNKMTKELAYSLKIGHRIKAIRERLDAITIDKKDFHFIQSSIEPQVMNRGRETYSFVLEENVVGREDDKKEIIKLLLDTNTVENVSVIPITCVSDNFVVKRIVKQILECFGGKSTFNENLMEKKYFIVLDDMWNEDKNQWILLKDLLMGGARGSRIMVTTRSIKVVEIMGTTSPHELKGLAPEKAWSLFVKMAFKEGKELENQTLVALGTDYNELSKIAQQENSISLTLKLSYDHLPSHLKQCFAYCRLFPKDHRIYVNTLIDLWIAQGSIELEGPRQHFVDIGRKYFMELLWRSFFQNVENDNLGNIKSCKMHDLMHNLASLMFQMDCAILNSSGKNFIEKVHHVSTPNPRENLGNFTCNALVSKFKYLRALYLSNLSLHVVPHSIGELKHLRYLDFSDNKINFLPNTITKLLHLQTLKLNSCYSLIELPRDIIKSANLRQLDIASCSNLTHMPLGLGRLNSLEILTMFAGRTGGGLSELKELSNLGGSLMIRNLGHEKDDMEECKATNMKEKQHLQELHLWWDRVWDDGETKFYDEMSQPHPNLQVLWLSLYMALEYISDEDCVSNVLSGSSSSKTPFFPSLSYLELWKGWWRNSDDDDDNQPDHLLLPSYPPCLSQLKIVGCSNLNCMPLFLYIKEDLKMVRVSLKVLQQTMKMKMGATTSPSSCYFPLSQLQSMELCLVKDLESYPEEWLQNLVSLRKLKIYNCEELGSLPWIANLTSLQQLSIQGIRNIISLKQLTIENCPILWRRCLRSTGEDWPIISHLLVLRVLIF
ncbi:hypothetical protein ACJW31_11G144000 [Castanea mollissima]